MSIFLGISIPLIVKFVFDQVDMRVREDLMLETEIFDGILKNDQSIKSQIGLSQRNIAYPRNPEQLISLFNLFYAHRTPEDDTYIITTLGEDFYRAVPEALPPNLQPQTQFVNSLIVSRINSNGTLVLADQQSILYNVQVIQHNETILGRFIVLHSVEGERQEALDVLKIVIAVILGVFVISIFMTWLVAGKVLAPLPAILNAAVEIDEKSLMQRIQVPAQGELGDLVEAFNKMMDRLEVAFQSQQHFINDAGHELRTPITIIRGHLELLALDLINPSDLETINLTIDELDRMSRLVNDLILLARSERPNFLVLDEIELASFVAKLFTKIQTLADRHWHLEGTVYGSIVGDYQRLTQVMLNLVQNAIQHTQVDDHITLGVSIDRQSFSLWVTDTGEGVPIADQKRIFERFARVRGSLRRSDGSGLGLAIVKRIVESHHGKINLDSQVGVGSTFRLTLPLQDPLHSSPL